MRKSCEPALQALMPTGITIEFGDAWFAVLLVLSWTPNPMVPPKTPFFLPTAFHFGFEVWQMAEHQQKHQTSAWIDIIYIYTDSAVCSMSKYRFSNLIIFFFKHVFFCENILIISCHQLQRSSVVSKSTTPWAAKSEERCSLGTKPAKLENIVASKFTEDLFSVGQYLRSEIRRFLFLFQTSHPMLGSTYCIRFI